MKKNNVIRHFMNKMPAYALSCAMLLGTAVCCTACGSDPGTDAGSTPGSNETADSSEDSAQQSTDTAVNDNDGQIATDSPGNNSPRANLTHLSAMTRLILRLL